MPPFAASRIESLQKGAGTYITEASAPVAATASRPVPQGPAIIVGGGDRVEPMSRMRQLIADHMVMSKHTSPHVHTVYEIDMSTVDVIRKANKERFLAESGGAKLTYTVFMTKVVIDALKAFPVMNASLKGTDIVYHGDINVGMAVSLDDGLIVPVIKDADLLNLNGLAHKVNDLANRARVNKLTPDEIQGGTYTVTNVGTFGNVMGTPIINQPQCAILALGAIRKKPAVIETPQGDLIGIRHMMYLSHAYDHRVIDGALGGSFVRRVADYLESFDVNRDI